MPAMMPKSSQLIINLFCTLSVLILLSLAQTTMWFQVFHPVPAPNLWLPVIVYFSLYRPFKLGVSCIYVSGLFLATMTSQPLYLLLLNLLCIYFGLQVLRLKFFWSGTGYFVMVCTASIFLLHFSSWLLSLNFENNFLRHPRYGAWIFQLFIMPFLAPIVFAIFRRIDSWTQFQIPNEYGFETL